MCATCDLPITRETDHTPTGAVPVAPAGNRRGPPAGIPRARTPHAAETNATGRSGSDPSLGAVAPSSSDSTTGTSPVHPDWTPRGTRPLHSDLPQEGAGMEPIRFGARLPAADATVRRSNYTAPHPLLRVTVAPLSVLPRTTPPETPIRSHSDTSPQTPPEPTFRRVLVLVQTPSRDPGLPARPLPRSCIPTEAPFRSPRAHDLRPETRPEAAPAPVKVTPIRQQNAVAPYDSCLRQPLLKSPLSRHLWDQKTGSFMNWQPRCL
jgi:hypothetical protein